MLKKMLHFFDKVEDRVRIHLSRRPIFYALIGAVGIILLWKGVWETAELVPALFGPGSIALGVALLLATGLLVSFFIGDNIILSGYKREKKLVERTEAEILKTEHATEKIIQKLEHIEKDVHSLKPLPLDTPTKGV